MTLKSVAAAVTIVVAAATLSYLLAPTRRHGNEAPRPPDGSLPSRSIESGSSSSPSGTAPSGALAAPASVGAAASGSPRATASAPEVGPAPAGPPSSRGKGVDAGATVVEAFRAVVVSGAATEHERLLALHDVHSAGGSEAIQVLIGLAEDGALLEVIRRHAILKLGQHAADETLVALTRLTADPSASARLAAVQALGQLQSPRAVPVLVDVVDRSIDARLGTAGLHGLMQAGTASASTYLIELVDRPELPAGVDRPAVLQAISRVRSPDAVPGLLAAYRGGGADSELQRALLQALAGAADLRAFEVFVGVAENGANVDARCAAIEGLGHLGDARALAVLEQRLVAGEARERSYARTAIQRIKAR